MNEQRISPFATTATPIPESYGLSPVSDLSAFTWAAEGNDNPKSPYYSRVPHWPGEKSGLTIGRGYDIGQRSAAEVI
jgi:hypothetical protein